MVLLPSPQAIFPSVSLSLSLEVFFLMYTLNISPLQFQCISERSVFPGLREQTVCCLPIAAFMYLKVLSPVCSVLH